MKTEGLIDLLQQQITRLRKNRGDDVGGFFFVLAPEADQPIANMFFGSGPSKNAFYKYLADQIGEGQKQSNDPYVGVPRGIR